MTRRGSDETRRRAPCSRELVRASALGFGVLAALCAAGCFRPDAGVEPNTDQIYFPVGMALTPPWVLSPDGSTHVVLSGPDAVGQQVTRKWLYVVNSDFDLQYNAGTVQVYDLDGIEKEFDAAVQGHCRNGPAPPADQFKYPGPCASIEAAPLLKQSVKIGAFATDVIYMRRSADATPAKNAEGRLVVPVRGDDTLHWLDAGDDGSLDCGQDANDACDPNHHRGDNSNADNTRDATLPPEPFGVAADDRGESVVTTHQSDGALGLFFNDWEDGANGGPTLQFVLGGLPSGPMGVASVPEPAVSRALRGTQSATFYEPAYYVGYRNAAEVQVVRYFSDRGDFMGNAPEQPPFPARAFLDQGAIAPILTNSQGFDSRGIAVDPSARDRCEVACDTAPGPAECRKDCVDAPPTSAKDPKCDPSGGCGKYVACLRTCASTPLDVYVSNRTPPSLILGQSTPTPSAVSSDDVPRFYSNVALEIGASRVVIGQVLVSGPDGKKTTATRVFAICFDSQAIFVYDPVALRFDTVIRTGRGPHSLAVDETRGLGYVGHFTDSYVGVVDLDRTRSTYGKMILTIGTPVPPRAQK